MENGLNHHSIQGVLNLWMPGLAEAPCSKTLLEQVLDGRDGFEHVGHADFWKAFREQFGSQPLFFSIKGLLEQSGHEGSPCHLAITV